MRSPNKKFRVKDECYTYTVTVPGGSVVHMDIRGQVKGSVITLGVIGAIFGGAMLANADTQDTPTTTIVEPVAVVKTAPPAPVVPAPAPEPVVAPEVVMPEPVVVPEAPAPEPAPEPVVTAAPGVSEAPIGPPTGKGPVILQPGELPPADAPAGTVYAPPPPQHDQG